MTTNQLAYGFTGKTHLLGQRLTDVGSAVVWGMISESVAEYNRQMAAMLAAVANPTSLYTERFRLPSSGTLQPLDEWGNPRPERLGEYFDVAYPIQGGGTAFGLNRVSSELVTVEEINALTVERLQRDADWMRRHMLAALFTNTTWSYADDQHGALTIQCLANGDTVTYGLSGGTVATDTHYLAQASAIDDSNNPYDDIYTELMEHPSNSGPVVAYIPTDLVATTKALTAFVEIGDPDLRYGTGATQIAAPFSRRFGDEVLGKVNNVWVVEWRALPSGYIVAFAEGGGPPLGMRQYPSTALQGLFTENHSPDGNLQESRFIRYAGFGARNRIAALVYRIGNGSYAIPTGYTAPLPA